MKITYLLLAISHMFIMSNSRVAVNVREGRLLGIVEEGSRGSYIAFKGIPYAKPPVGDLRFKDPVPAEPWTGERNASKYGNVSVQLDIITNKIIGDEDCLYLNVFTTDIKPTKQRAVMVWIYGGGFYSGEDFFYGPEYIVPKQVVLVTLNYRVGALGFLNLYDKVATGNQGLKDQAMALRWVRDNISQFGGDPGNVTIFGESAGSASVHFLTLSPFAEGLFHKAISQSGVASNPWSWTERTDSTMNKGFQLAAKLGKETSDPKVAYEFLKTVDAEKLVEAQMKYLSGPEDIQKSILPFTPSMDSESANPFFPEPIENYIRRGVKVPFMLGTTSDEGILFVDSKFKHLTKEEIKKANDDFKNVMNPKTVSEIATIPMTVEELRSLYFGDKPVSEKTLSNYSDYFGDALIIRGTMKIVDLQTKLKSPTYLYQFSYVSEKPTVVRAANEITLPGVGHGEDNAFLFSSDLWNKFDLSPPTPGSNDYKMIEYMTDLWTNFAKTGNPTPAITKMTPVTWTPLRSGGVYDYLDININTQMKAFHKGKERWDWETRKNKLHN